MDGRKVAFITCVNDEEEYAEALYYIGRLYVPDGYVIDPIAIREAESMTAGYQAGMENSDAKYKVYLHQDTFIINRAFICDMLKVFHSDENIGILGCIGCDCLPLHVQAVSSWNTGTIYSNGFPGKIVYRQDADGKHKVVECLDGLLLATQYDVNWRSDLFDGWDYYDISQCFEMRRKGYKAAVPYMEMPWCYHDNGYSKMTEYQMYGKRFADEYQDIKQFEAATASPEKNEFDRLKETSRKELKRLVEEGAKEELLLIFEKEENKGYLHLREFEALAEIEKRERQAVSVQFWSEKASYKELAQQLRALRFALKRMEYGADECGKGLSFVALHYSIYAAEVACRIYQVENDHVLCSLIERYRRQATKISILMCTYNSADTVRAAVESVRRQLFAGWELVILDNGSTDDTVELLREYCQIEPRISCIYQSQNIGWCKGISICLAQAAGEYMMFMGADDLLATEHTLAEVNSEIEKHRPDVVWTGNVYAVLEEGSYKEIDRTVPPYKVFQGREHRLCDVSWIMNEVYYNSMMHYVRTGFLKEHGIDFFEPFYGDCQGMTEVLCKAEKMVVINRTEYILTLNTSQTAQKVGFDYDMQMQWNSIAPLLKHQEAFEYASMIAQRILNNLSDMCVRVLTGTPLRNRYMQDIEEDVSGRFLKAEEWISSDAFGEMMYYAGRGGYGRILLFAAADVYWKCKENPETVCRIRRKSTWLAVFVETAFTDDGKGGVEIKKYLSREDTQILIAALRHTANKHRIGCELLLEETQGYEDENAKETIRTVLRQYLNNY